jgi:hypothetical protein
MTDINVAKKIGEEEKRLQRQKITKSVALITTVVGACYAVFSHIFYPSLIIYPIACVIISLLALALNKTSWNDVARLVLSVLVMALAFVYHAFIVQPGEPIIYSLYMIQMSLSVIPWVLFDYNERSYLIPTLLICYAMFFTQNVVNQQMSMPLDSTMFREGLLNNVSYIFAVLILVSCLIFLKIKYHEAEKRKYGLVGTLEDQKDELRAKQSELEKTMDEVNASRKEEEKRTWTATGLSEISDILRENDTESNIFDKVLSKLIRYTNSNQGGIYLLEDDLLILTSSYAYNHKKIIEQQVSVENGLLGQATKGKDAIYLKEVPDSYVTITSGLGESTPRNILIIPLILNEAVEGVMEFASFNLYEDHQIAFIKRVGENIASYIFNYKSNEKTRQLLKQSQEHSEQMRAQEEEMRQNLEELSATQEQMARKEREYLKKIKDLEDQALKSKI